MNEELDDAAVTAAVAGYPRTGRDLADGYLLAALVIRAMYDGEDPEITRALRLYSGDVKRLTRLSDALTVLGSLVRVEAERRYHLESLADAASTVLLPRFYTEEDREAQRELNERASAAGRAGWSRVPGEVTQEIRRPVAPPHRYTPSTLEFDEACAYLPDRSPGDPVVACGRAYADPIHHQPCRHLLRAPNGRCMDCGMDAA